MLSIQSFISQINSDGLARNYQFLVSFAKPQQLNSTMSEQSLSLKCNVSHLPGRLLNVKEYRTYGPIQKMAYGGQYESNEMGLILSANLQERDFFMAWQDLAIGNSRSSDVNLTSGMFDIGYFDDYKSMITIEKLDNLNDIRYSCTLHDAFPISIAPIILNWESNEIATLGINIAYRYFTEKME